MTQGIKRGAIVEFPTEIAENEWLDELEGVLGGGIEGGQLGSFIGFAIMKDGESGVHMGMIDTENQISTYVLLGALEAMKSRILNAIGGS